MTAVVLPTVTTAKAERTTNFRTDIAGFAIGVILFMHGYAKVANLGIARAAANFGTNYGLPMPTFLAYSAVSSNGRRHLHR